MKESLLETYFTKLRNCGISDDSIARIKESWGSLLSEASYSTKADSGLAYEGSLIETILGKLTVFAVKLNNLYPEEIRVNKKSLVKVCLLQHISKCQRMTKQTNVWRKNNLGEIYTYADGLPAIGTGLHSLMMAAGAGIELLPFEVEAITIIDRKEDDLQAKFHCSLLSSIVRQANEMVYMQEIELKKLENKGSNNDK